MIYALDAFECSLRVIGEKRSEPYWDTAHEYRRQNVQNAPNARVRKIIR